MKRSDVPGQNREEGGESMEPLYLVVVNGEEQYSIWMAHMPLPLGWHTINVSGSKQQCLEYIAKTWTDIRPKSVRQSN